MFIPIIPMITRTIMSLAAANDIVQAVRHALTEHINHLDDVIVQIEPRNQ